MTLNVLLILIMHWPPIIKFVFLATRNVSEPDSLVSKTINLVTLIGATSPSAKKIVGFVTKREAITNKLLIDVTCSFFWKFKIFKNYVQWK